MAKNGRLFKHFQTRSLEAQVLETIDKSGKNIKVDCVPCNIVIQQEEQNLNNIPTLNNEKQNDDVKEISYNPIKAICDFLDERISYLEKGLLDKQRSPIMSDLTTAPKKGKKTRRHKKNGT